jgi:hypothetical protein
MAVSLVVYGEHLSFEALFGHQVAALMRLNPNESLAACKWVAPKGEKRSLML